MALLMFLGAKSNFTASIKNYFNGHKIEKNVTNKYIGIGEQTFDDYDTSPKDEKWNREEATKGDSAVRRLWTRIISVVGNLVNRLLHRDKVEEHAQVDNVQTSNNGIESLKRPAEHIEPLSDEQFEEYSNKYFSLNEEQIRDRIDANPRIKGLVKEFVTNPKYAYAIEKYPKLKEYKEALENDPNAEVPTDILEVNVDQLKELQKGHMKNEVNKVIEYYNSLPSNLQAIVDVEDLKLAAMLHDYGKVLMPDELVNGPIFSTDSDKRGEQEFMALHAEFGYELLKSITDENGNPAINDKVLNLVRYHHQNITGDTKYYTPVAEKDKDKYFNPELIILEFADIEDALQETRSYKEGLNEQDSTSLFIIENYMNYQPVETGNEEFVPITDGINAKVHGPSDEGYSYKLNIPKSDSDSKSYKDSLSMATLLFHYMIAGLKGVEHNVSDEDLKILADAEMLDENTLEKLKQNRALASKE